MRLIPTILFLAIAAPASAQVSVVRVGADSLSVGEWTALVIAVAHDGSRRAVFPDDARTEVPAEAIGIAGDFELLERIASGSKTLRDGNRMDSVVYRATTFALDTAYALPRVGLASDTDTVAVAGMPLMIPVRSTVPDEATDIQDITPLAEFPRTWWPWLVLLAGLVAAWIVYGRYRKRTPVAEAEPLPEPEPVEAPLEEALRRLGELAAADVSGDDAMKPFYVELSDILRTYVARRTGVPALELTTAELTRELTGIRHALHIADERVRDVDRILQAADLVKFADLHPGADIARRALEETTVAVRVTEQDLAVPEPLPEEVER